MKIRGFRLRIAASIVAGVLFLTAAVPVALSADTDSSGDPSPGSIPTFSDPTDPLESGRMMFVRTSQPASVLLDGEIVGTSPGLFTELDAGEHTLTVRSASLTHRRTLVVRDSIPQVTFYTPVMHPFTGSLEVATEPTGALVFLDGVAAGNAPLTLPGLEIGQYELAVEAPGHVLKMQTVQVSQDETTALSLELEPAPAAGSDGPQTALVLLEGLLPESFVFLNHTNVTSRVSDGGIEAEPGLTDITVLTSNYVPFTTQAALRTGERFTIELPNTVDPVITGRPRRIAGWSTLVPGAVLSAGGLIMNLDAIAIGVTNSYQNYVTVKYASLGAAGAGIVLVGVGLVLTVVL